MKSIPFNKAVCLENSIECLENAVKDNKLSGNGKYTKMCTDKIRLLIYILSI